MMVISRGRRVSISLNGVVVKEDRRIIYPVEIIRPGSVSPSRGFLVVEHTSLTSLSTNKAIRLKGVLKMIEDIIDGAIVTSASVQPALSREDFELNITALNKFANVLTATNVLGRIVVDIKASV